MTMHKSNVGKVYLATQKAGRGLKMLSRLQLLRLECYVRQSGERLTAAARINIDREEQKLS